MRIIVQVWGQHSEPGISEIAESVADIELHRYSENYPASRGTEYRFLQGTFLENAEAIRKFIMRCLTLNRRIVIYTSEKGPRIDVADESQIDDALRALTTLLRTEAELNKNRTPSPDKPSAPEKTA